MAMDELEISKIVGAGCAALLAFVGFGQLGSALVGVKQLDEPAYIIEIADAGDVEVEEEEAMPIGQLMAMAVVDDGAKVFRKCSACHKMDDGANGVGPHLYGVVGRDIGGVDGYSYSSALMEKDGPWDFAALDGFLEAPKDWAPGTKMGFNGLSKPEDRASLIAWLNEQGPAPLPLPAAEAAEAEPEPAEAVTAALEPDEEIAPGDVEPGEVSEVDAGEAETEAEAEVAVVNPEAPREAEVTEARIADAAPTGDPVETGEPAVVEAPVEDEEPARVETAETERGDLTVTTAEAEVEVVKPAEEVEVVVAPAPAPAATGTEDEAGTATEMAMVEQPEAEEAAPPAVVEAEPDAAPAPQAEPAETVELADAVATATFMIGADAAQGAKVFRKCKACHRVEADKGNAVGPNLHGVVGRVIASHDGFNYSDALKGKDGAWDFETLAAFLTKPKDWAPGTKMAFPGLRKEQDRADVIAYLNEQSDNPLPLPE